MSEERRTFQRLALTSAVDGWFGDFAIRLLDVSATGALIEYDEDIPLDSRALLRFYWRGEEVEVLAEIARRGDGQSGLHFLDNCPTLNHLIAQSVAELLAAQVANAFGDRAANVIGDGTLTSASPGIARSAVPFIVCTLADGVWTRRGALLAEQPENGFTIAATEPLEEIEKLCRTYEQGDAEARRLTRMFAELSAASVV